MPETSEESQLQILDMTKEEAVTARDEINKDAGQYYARQRARVLEFYVRRGWSALGYKTWTDCVEKEFGHARSRTYELLDEAKIADEIESSLAGSGAKLTGRALLALKAAPAGQRGAVLQQAQEEHGTPAPSGGQIQATVAKGSWKKSRASAKPKPKKKKSAPAESIGEQAEKSERLHKALMVIGDTCGRNFRKAIEDGTIEMSKADVLELSELEDDRMQEVEKLISVNRWTVKRALKFLDKQPELTDPIETLTNLALASLDDEWTGDFGAFTITVKVHRRKLNGK
jgi:hypothetical protein